MCQTDIPQLFPRQSTQFFPLRVGCLFQLPLLPDTSFCVSLLYRTSLERDIVTCVSIILPNLAAPRHHHLLLVVRPFQLRRYLPLPPEVNSFFRQRQPLLFVRRFFSFEFRVSTALSPSAARRLCSEKTFGVYSFLGVPSFPASISHCSSETEVPIAFSLVTVL